MLPMEVSLTKAANGVELTIHQTVMTNVSSTRQRRRGRTSNKTTMDPWTSRLSRRQRTSSSSASASSPPAKPASNLDNYVSAVRAEILSLWTAVVVHVTPSRSRKDASASTCCSTHYFDITRTRGATTFRSGLTFMDGYFDLVDVEHIRSQEQCTVTWKRKLSRSRLSFFCHRPGDSLRDRDRWSK